MTTLTLPIVGTLSHQRFTPGATDDAGMPTDAWGTAAEVTAHGWWPPSQDQIMGEASRRAQEINMAVIIPQGTVCGDRDRWTVGGFVLEQVGGAQDYSHGPFGMAVPLIVHLGMVNG